MVAASFIPGTPDVKQAQEDLPASNTLIRSGSRPPPDIHTVGVNDLPTVKKAPFRRLKMRHRRIIACHIQGVSNSQIAVSIGCSAGYISQVLNNPTVIPILQRCYQEYETEFQALTPLCIAALRDSLESDDPVNQMKAVDLTFKRQGAYDRKESTAATAEDVIERILKISGKDGTKLEFSERRFLRADGQQEDEVQEVVDV